MEVDESTESYMSTERHRAPGQETDKSFCIVVVASVLKVQNTIMKLMVGDSE